MYLQAIKTIYFIRNSLVLLFLLLIPKVSAESGRMDSSVIVRAMKDELNRNMQHLVYKDFAKPFYIGYTIADSKTYYIGATLGAIETSEEIPNRDWQVRVLVGNYQLNDENYQDVNASFNSQLPYLSIPLDNDYYGIRRALWVATDQVYKSAGQTYKSKLNAIKENNLDPKELSIADFSKVPVVKMDIPSLPVSFDKIKYEQIARDVSSEFRKYPDVVTSEVLLVFFHTDIYFISSEGIEIHRPLTMTSFFINAQVMSDDGDVIPDHVSFYAALPSGLPDLDTFKKSARTLAHELINLKNAPVFNDSYTGPVLIMQQAVPELVFEELFSGSQSLIASREPLYNVPQMRMYYGQDNFSLESRIGKRITDEKLSVVVTPKLNQYKNIPLIGSFPVDAEGVTPQDTLVLVKNGFLETLLNGRTPTRKIALSNGHDRYTMMGGSISTKVGPGVVSVSSSETSTVNALKKELIRRAKEEGLDYAIIIRPVKQSNSHQPLNVYKVNLENGNEQLVRSVNMETITLDKLRQIPGISDTQTVYNTLLNNSYSEHTMSVRSVGASASGLPVSFIVPEALLLDNIQLAGVQKPISGKLPAVSNPVK